MGDCFWRKQSINQKSSPNASFFDKLAKLGRKGVFKHKGITQDAIPKRITVPPLTIKEKQFLDSKLIKGASSSGRGTKIPFEIEKAHVDSYIENYKHYPSYHEVLF